MANTILIVDDDASIATSLSLVLKQAGYSSQTSSSPQEALQNIGHNTIDLVLQDMNFSRQTSGEEGLKLLKEIRQRKPNLPVILMTAWGSIALAVKGIQSGASDFITKPWTNEQLLQSIKTVLGLAAVTSTTAGIQIPSREELDRKFDFSNIIGADAKFLSILDLVGRISPTDASVLITGESGTGKELIAEAIHRNSNRRNAPFIKVNLGGISSTLFESEMFGHVKGAFTDAHQDRKGRFELAHGGTIFLDEIGDLDMSCQVKLLRVLQDRTYEVLGSSTTRSVDVRVIAATNGSLVEMIEQGDFREDLLYRLNLITVHLPPLRERKGDIPLLANYFLHNIGRVYRRNTLSISKPAMTWLQHLQWRGNIRELKHLVERTVLVSTKDVLETDDFTSPMTMDRISPSDEILHSSGTPTLDEMEKMMIEKYLKEFNGNISKVAGALGVSRAALYRRFEKFGMKP